MCERGRRGPYLPISSIYVWGEITLHSLSATLPRHEPLEQNDHT